MLGGVSFSQGLISGLDFGAVVDAIIDAERAPIRSLERRIDTFERARSRFDSFGSLLADFESALSTLKGGSGIGGKTVSINAEEPPFSATATASAAPGLYEISVTALAEANRVRSDGFADQFSPLVSDGTITIQSGENDPIDIDVSAANGNNSLLAVAESINGADAGVTASIINDGTNDILIVRADKTGLSNALNITDSTNLNLDVAGNELQAAADASISVDGVVINSETNSISGAIAGVTLDITGTTTSPIELTIDNDVDGAKQALTEFVDAYNAVNDFFVQEFSGGGGTSSSLTNTSVLRNIQSSVQRIVAGSVTGVPEGKLASLAELGVTVADRTGRLEFSESDFDEIVSLGRFDEARAVLESTGSTTDASVIFVTGNRNTVAGNYAINVTNAPESAQVQLNLPNRLGRDETFTIDLNGESVDVDLARRDRPQDVLDKINAALDQSGLAVSASRNGRTLTLVSDDVGSDQVLTLSALGQQIVGTGEDIAGTIGGVAATGNGRELSGAQGSDAEGIVVKIFATAASVAAKNGDFGEVGYSEGVVDASLNLIDQIADPFDGTLKSVTDGFESSIETMQDRIERVESRLTRREEILIRQFSAAEQAISQLQLFQSSLQQTLR